MSIKKTRVYSSIRKLYYDFLNRDEIREKNRVKGQIGKYKDTSVGKICVVVGNGPSLRMDDLTMLEELRIPTFACNRITKAFSQTTWRPTYYFISDEKLLSDYPDDVDGVPAERRFFPKAFEGKICNGIFYNPGPEYVDFEKEGRFSLDAAEGVYGGGTVTVEMLQFAYYMGFREIYLIGVDFSYAVDSPLNNKTYSYKGENNYFIKDYLKPGEIASIPNIEANLLAFHAARDAAEKNGFTIKNATRGGKLEVFERADLDQLFIRWSTEKRQ